MALLYNEATPFSGDVLGLLMFSFVAVSTTYIYSTLINAMGQTKKMNWLFMIAIVINIGLNLILIPSMKAKGAAISTLITQSFVAVGIVLLSSRLLPRRGGFNVENETDFFCRAALFEQLDSC
ncbi:MAG: hypothetical protein HC817_11090 [Saprospiraceae bacterium]|nr:hypothetical protein [Saprospiraceae bacterium]